jgi:hypothetical protein
MTKSRGIGRGGRRPGAGRKPKPIPAYSNQTPVEGLGDPVEIASEFAARDPVTVASEAAAASDAVLAEMQRIWGEMQSKPNGPFNPHLEFTIPTRGPGRFNTLDY